MNPNQDGRHFNLMASGIFLRPGSPGHSALQVSSSAGSPARSTDPLPPRPAEKNKSPYPGINIGSASELLDFRFEDTEFLQGSED
jgi:hypothetical protein